MPGDVVLRHVCEITVTALEFPLSTVPLLVRHEKVLACELLGAVPAQIAASARVICGVILQFGPI